VEKAEVAIWDGVELWLVTGEVHKVGTKVPVTSATGCVSGQVLSSESGCMRVGGQQRRIVMSRNDDMYRM
jgi:hypothetical protein